MAVERQRYCIQCDSELASFEPYRDGRQSPVMEALAVIGSDVVNFACPKCWGFDRERHLILYFNALDLWSRIKAGRVLHVAPEPDLGRRIREIADTYVAADLVPTRSGVHQLDLTRVNYPTECFDVVVANHVLEHIPRDDLALSEVMRVLAPGGMAILQTPFTWRLGTSLENPSIVEPDLRDLLFGQEDHVRVYGRDLFARMQLAGLEVILHEHSDILWNIDAERFGVNEREPLICAFRPRSEVCSEPDMPS